MQDNSISSFVKLRIYKKLPQTNYNSEIQFIPYFTQYTFVRDLNFIEFVVDHRFKI